MSEKIFVRPATQDDLDLIAHLKTVGFGGDEAERRADLENNPRYNYRHMVIAELEGQAVGTATAFPTQMWISGVPLQMGAVASVITLPAFRNRGVAAAMMQQLLENMARDGLAISVLFPFVQGLYYRCGYADAAVWHFYSIKADNLSVYAEAAHVRPFALDDLPTIRSIYRGSQLSQADGRLTRSSSYWDRWLRMGRQRANFTLVVYDGDEGVEGYLAYSKSADNTLKVTELVVHSDAAYRGLWGYLAGQPDISGIDYLAPPDDPILHLMKRPRDRQGRNRGWVFDDIYHATSAGMLRVIDVAEALTSRFYPHDMMGNRVFKIHDPQLPHNERPVNFRIVDGRPDIIPLAGQTPQVETDIATFSQLFCGFLPAEAARRLGRLQADDETIEWLDKAMAAKPLFIHEADWF